jgi:bifunctional non-homologous end joining protein LigD
MRKQMPSYKSLKPMLATLVADIPEQGEWFYEIKWDGYRALAFCQKRDVNLVSRNQKLFNDKYYPLYKALQALNLNAVLDGEIVALKDGGMPSFEALQNWRSEADGQLFYYVFDLLWLDGESVIHFPLSKRKDILRKILPPGELIRQNDVFQKNPKKFLEAVGNTGLEGIIAKRIDSLYTPGLRSVHWLKIKVKKRQEAVIGGYTQNENSPKLFSSLLVGVFDGAELHYIGKIGTGFTQKLQHQLMALFRPFVTGRCPFVVEPDINLASRFRPNPPRATATWLVPKIVCEVSYVEMTSDGVMRHPSFEGLRDDKQAKNVHKESAEATENIFSKPALKIPQVKKKERKTLLNPSEASQTKEVNGHVLKFQNLSKEYWPDEGYTKRDLINYYYQMAPYLLPYLKNRPQSLNRFPNGIYGKSFYQKDVTKMAPDWMQQFPYHTSDGKDKNYLIVQDEADILWMSNLGAIEMNPWNSTLAKPDYPSWCTIDIDPTEKNTFEQVIETALVTKEVLDALNIEGYCKTSGAAGLHIYIPMGAKYTYEECQLFGRKLAQQIHRILPHFTSVERYTFARRKKIYVDFLQNRPKATLAAPYSVRPMPGAPVSMPLHWEEVKKGLHPQKFNLKNAFQRVLSEGDVFWPVIGKGINLKKAFKNLENFLV